MCEASLKLTCRSRRYFGQVFQIFMVIRRPQQHRWKPSNTLRFSWRPSHSCESGHVHFKSEDINNLVRAIIIELTIPISSAFVGHITDIARARGNILSYCTGTCMARISSPPSVAVANNVSHPWRKLSLVLVCCTACI